MPYPSVASFDAISGNKIDAQKVQEDEVVLRFISEGFKDYEYAKSPIMI